MNWRLYTVLLGLATIGVISGCATQPRSAGTSVTEEPISGPSTVIAGAKVAEVRAIAMGSARSKGWTIVRATDQRVVLSRPVNPDAPQAVAAGLVATGMRPQIEVTSVYQQVPNGVQVTVSASLVTMNDQGAGAQRTDYTEAYADNLSRSLDSLRAAWAENHQRVARALPPIDTAGQSAAETAAELSANPGTATPSDAPQQSPLPDETAPTAWGAAQAAEPVPEYASAPPPDTTAPVVAAPAAAQPEPQAGSQSTGSFPAPVRSYAPTQPIATTTPVQPADNMMALNRGPAARDEVGNAERYAALRGCQVQAGRTAVFRRDPDAEYLRVYCAGDPAFVVKCSNGVCKGLE